ncbi:MAG: hypothetical protein ACK4UY_05690 [Dietzia sp.]
MNLSTRSVTRGAVAAAAVAALTVGTSVAGAQIPGGGHQGVVVNTDSNALVVSVNDKGENPTTVTGSIQNTTANNFRCATPGYDLTGEFPGQVTTAEVVEETIGFYRSNIYSGPDGFAAPGGGAPISLGSIQELLPTGSDIGSSTVDTRAAQQAARVAGRTGNPQVGSATAFNVNAGQTVNWSAALGVPSTGDRGEWRAAAMFYCIDQVTGSHYIFYGYEPLPEPEEPVDPEAPEEQVVAETGGISSGSLGS